MVFSQKKHELPPSWSSSWRTEQWQKRLGHNLSSQAAQLRNTKRSALCKLCVFCCAIDLDFRLIESWGDSKKKLGRG